MEKYYCKTSTGVRPPRYEHDNIKSATEEAKRLSTQFNCSVQILKVVCTVSYKDIPITERKQVVEFESGYSNSNGFKIYL
jgi:hypothetical protein